MIKRSSIILALFVFSSLAFAQEKKEILKTISTWQISEGLGKRNYTNIQDSSILNFHKSSTDHNIGIANAYCGNLGSPLESKIYFNRKEKSKFLFLKPYNSYFLDVEDYFFYNTTTPYSNISYYTAGPSYAKEERFKSLFSVNINPRLSVGFLTDYTYGRGMYQYQSTNHFTSGIWTSYIGKKYNAHAIASLNNFKNYENGGIKDDLYITNPQEMNSGMGTYKPQNIEVNLTPKTQSQLKNRLIYLNQNYSLGLNKTNIQDSSKTDFIPVTTFTHTIKYESNAKRFFEPAIPENFYQNIYIDSLLTQDTAYIHSLKNTVAISLNEEFNKIAKFGLSAFISNKIEQRKFIEDSALTQRNFHNTSIGGILSKKLGRKFQYEALGEIYVLGYQIGDFNLSGSMNSSVFIKKDTLLLSVKGFIKNQTPDFFLEQYESNHFKWNNSFSKEYKTQINGELSIPNRRFSVSSSVENITNHIYFNNNALPTQDDGNLQVVAFNLKKKFSLKNIHLENEITYQISGNESVLPLPKWSFYHNLYYTQRLFKVLNMQLGLDVHYHTKYYAPIYTPAIGQFITQQEKQIGNYPLVNIYGNFHLKQIRFFFMYYHANYNISEPNYFSMPGYPINPSTFKIGLSWNFYN